MTDESERQIWERACGRVGLRTSRRIPSPIGGTVLWFDFPPIHDHAATVAMLEWMAAEIDVPMRDDETGEIVQVPDRRGLPEVWFDEDGLWHARPYGYADTVKHPKLSLALAAAVCALKEN